MIKQSTIDKWLNDAGLDASAIIRVSEKGEPIVAVTCGRCGGCGRYSYNPMDGDRCWGCSGGGRVAKKLRSVAATARRNRPEAIAKREAKAAEKKRREQAEARVATVDFLRSFPDLHAAFVRGAHPIVRSIASQLVRKGHLSEKQVAFVLKLDREAAERKVEREEREASEIEVPEGRQRVEGEVVGVKEVASDYGYQLKVLVQCDGFRLWGSLPKSISEAEKGDRIAFDAKLQPQEKGFGFYSRPTKAEIVELSPKAQAEADFLEAVEAYDRHELAVEESIRQDQRDRGQCFDCKVLRIGLSPEPVPAVERNVSQTLDYSDWQWVPSGCEKRHDVPAREWTEEELGRQIELDKLVDDARKRLDDLKEQR